MENDFLDEYVKFLNSLSTSIYQIPKFTLPSYFKNLQVNTDALSERTKRSLKTLGDFGWYLPSLNHPCNLPTQLAEELIKGNEDYVNKEMCIMIKKEFKYLCNQLLDKNHKRIKLLKSAFKAHKSKKYALSVPVFLSQAEGICKEISGHSLFLKDREHNCPQTKKYIDSLNKNSFIISYLEPLRIVLPIIFSGKDNQNVKFNRHRILHGEDIMYDTELISLKAFSLLSYINTILR